MESPIYIQDGMNIPGRELWFTASLSGGPGGQHVNKVNSRVTLFWHFEASVVLNASQKQKLRVRLKSRISNDGVLQVVVDTHRSQHRNRLSARERLAFLVQDALTESKKRIPTRVSLSAKRRRLENKRRRGTVKGSRRMRFGSDHE